MNQYPSRDVPGFVNVIGTASNLATVTLWGDNGAFSPTSRKGDYFRGELAVSQSERCDAPGAVPENGLEQTLPQEPTEKLPHGVNDRWNLIATLNPQLSPINSFAWGLDLSGSLQGAGGVGGLLMVTDQTAINNQPSTHFPAYDGNGNMAALVAAASGTVSATYEYGPFSEVVRLTGPMAHANKFRFSTKYQDDESDFLYYGYRSYNPSLGRWFSRDPILEIGFRSVFLGKRLKGGLHECAFVRNNPINMHDVDGLGIACAVKWATQVELGHAAPMNCAGSAIADSLILLKSAYPNYNPNSNGHNALHCLANCLMAKYCRFPGKSNDEIYDHMMDANSDYELCTAKEELCGKWCGDQNLHKQDVMSDIKADIVGVKAGLAGQDCIAACEPETRSSGPKQPDSCDCKKVKECETWFDKVYGKF